MFKYFKDKMFFVGFYVILLVSSVFMLLGYQNIIISFVPIWDELYFLINFLVVLLCLLSIYAIFSSRLKIAHAAVFGLLLTWIFYYLLLVYVSVVFNIEGGTIYRNFFGIIFIWVLSFRLLFLRKLIRTGGIY